MNNLKTGKRALLVSLLFSAVSILSISVVFTGGMFASEVLAGEVPTSEASAAQQLFKKKCSLCHGIDKKKIGPAVKNMSQEKETLLQIVHQGKKSMPAFEGKLSSGEIESLVDYLLSAQGK